MNSTWHPQWQLLADMHRPADPQAIGAEIRRLHQSGLTVRDVAVALRLDLGQVLTAISETR